MQFTCKPDQFSEALATAAQVIPPRPGSAVLGEILFEAEDDRVHLAATDLSLFVRVGFDANVDRSGQFLCPPGVVRDLVDTLRKKPSVTMNVDATNWSFQLSDGKGKANLHGRDPVEAMPFPDELPPLWEVDRAALRKAMTRALVVPDKDPIGIKRNSQVYHFQYWEIDKQPSGETLLRITVTDAACLLTQTVPVDPQAGAPDRAEFFVKIAAAAEIDRLLRYGKTSTAPVRIGCDPEAMVVQFEAAGCRVQAKIPATTKYHDWRRIVPKEATTTVTCSRQDLTDVMARLKHFTQNDIGTLQIGGGDVRFSATKDNFGDADQPLDGDSTTVEGKDLTLRVRLSDFMRVTQALDTDLVRVKLLGDAAPILCEAPEDPTFLYLTMPAAQ